MASSLVLCGVIPMLGYHYLTTRLHWTETRALTAIIVFPLVDAAWEGMRVRRVSLISGITLLGIAVSLVAAWLGGSPTLLLIRESLLTGTLGVACLLSLLLPRPLAFYLARSAQPQEDLDGEWQTDADMRHTFRVVTLSLGIGFSLEFLLKVALVYTLPVETVLVVAPIALTAVSAVTLGITYAYFRRRK